MIVEVIIGVLVLVGAFNIWATIRVARDQLATPSQRAAHIILVWVFPVLGGLMVMHLQRVNPERSSGRYATSRELGDDFGCSGRMLRNDNGAARTGTGAHDADD
jgi:hypothetical protein